jgi:hypothetical protein
MNTVPNITISKGHAVHRIMFNIVNHFSERLKDLNFNMRPSKYELPKDTIGFDVYFI